MAAPRRFLLPLLGGRPGTACRRAASPSTPALPTPEEFPRFTAFWLEAMPGERQRVIIYALLDSPSVTGAYRFERRAARTASSWTWSAELYRAQAASARLGVAPLTSMFWYSEHNRTVARDWRPEIHDTDGLAIWTGAGERIWRPLNNPPRVHDQQLRRRQSEGLRPAAARPQLRPLPGRRRLLQHAAVACGSSRSATGARARCNSSRSRPTTRSTTTSSPIGCPAEPSSRRAARLQYRLSWLDDMPIPGYAGPRDGNVDRDGRRPWPARGRRASQVRHRLPGQRVSGARARRRRRDRGDDIATARCRTPIRIRSSISGSAGARCSTSLRRARSPSIWRLPSLQGPRADQNLDLPVFSRELSPGPIAAPASKSISPPLPWLRMRIADGAIGRRDTECARSWA